MISDLKLRWITKLREDDTVVDLYRKTCREGLGVSMVSSQRFESFVVAGVHKHKHGQTMSDL